MRDRAGHPPVLKVGGWARRRQGRVARVGICMCSVWTLALSLPWNAGNQSSEVCSSPNSGRKLHVPVGAPTRLPATPQNGGDTPHTRPGYLAPATAQPAALEHENSVGSIGSQIPGPVGGPAGTGDGDWDGWRAQLVVGSAVGVIIYMTGCQGTARVPESLWSSRRAWW